MTRAYQAGVPICAAEVARWASVSLAEGSRLARSMMTRLGEVTSARAAMPASDRRERGEYVELDGRSRGVTTHDADSIMARMVSELGPGPQVLIVEDDLARRGDRSLARKAVAANVAYVDERVVRWMAVERDSVAAVEFLRSGASGYPLNAYVCRGTARELGLSPHAAVDAPECSRIVGALRALIVAVFDAESYVLMVFEAAACDGSGSMRTAPM